MSNEMKAAEASALGARTARACESCLKIRARWYCAADDAFLCHSCDNMVHSANQLASRHQRVKLQTSSSKLNYSLTPQNHNNKVAWHSGFTRKARTPRHNNNKHLAVQQQQQQQQQKIFGEEEEVFFNNTRSLLPLVPELGSEELLLNDENEEQLLCRVPVFDVELCSLHNEVKGEEEALDLEKISSEFLPSDMDLAEFAADVESLLGCKEEEENDEIGANANGLGAKDAMVKVKDEEEVDTCHLESILEMNNSDEAFDWNISELDASPQQEEEKVCKVETNNKKDMFLRLNYEDVITAWASQGSPWTTETPPKFNYSHDCWQDFLGWNSGGDDVQCCYEEMRSLKGHHGDGGREARVSRYREKRRTRLFAKKIRYEVRKLNAEKRPRMKGRFVKRTSFVGVNALKALN